MCHEWKCRVSKKMKQDNMIATRCTANRKAGCVCAAAFTQNSSRSSALTQHSSLQQGLNQNSSLQQALTRKTSQRQEPARYSSLQRALTRKTSQRQEHARYSSLQRALTRNSSLPYASRMVAVKLRRVRRNCGQAGRQGGGKRGMAAAWLAFLVQAADEGSVRTPQ